MDDLVFVSALNVARETYGRESRCFRQGDPWVARNSTGAVVSVQERFGAGCYRVISDSMCIICDLLLYKYMFRFYIEDLSFFPIVYM